jgi:capsular polysaccharide export protein
VWFLKRVTFNQALVVQKKIKLRRRDRSIWRAVAHLFPEFAVSNDRSALGARFDAHMAGSFHNEMNQNEAVFAPGLLRGPGFTPQSVWVSGTVKGWVTHALSAANPNAAEREQTAGLVKQMIAARVGGPFWAQEIPEGKSWVVLRPNDLAHAERLLDEALQAYQAAEILLLYPPSLNPSSFHEKCKRLGVEVITGPVDPWSVLGRCRALWVGGDDELASLGILTGLQVYCHSPGLAAGWGLTRDAPTISPRGNRDVIDFAAAVLLHGARYGDPRTGQAINAETAIALLAEWRAITQANRSIGCSVGISFWKRRRMAGFFHNGTASPRFVKTAQQALASDGQIAAWNSRLPQGLAAQAGPRLLRVEDGFIRSLGLGSGFLPPCSIVVDGRGIYYDPQRPSDLEHILSETVFDAALRQRAASLVARLNQRGITKYAAGGAADPIAAPAGRRRILVPGQVADDLSVALGGGAVRSNLKLLESVRARHPDAWLIYKPHPDVEAGHRPGAIAVADLQRCADQVVRGGAMSALIAQVDEVHTMTSLAGFEALLRGRVVTVYGQPFYAGWGLTTDLAPVSRRVRRLWLDELAAGVLILYPRYLDPVSHLPCSPELLLTRLEQPELWRPSTLMRLRALQGKLKRRLQNV